jgi:hypothetical protein
MDAAVRGTIRGTVRFAGRRWNPRLLDMSGDRFCVDAHTTRMMSEDFRVGPGGELEGVVVYLKRGMERQKFDPPAQPAVLDQKDCMYEPHVLVIQCGQPLIIQSSDATLHNVNGRKGANDGFNHAMSSPGRLAPKIFRKPEVAKRIGCDVHGWMVSWVAALPHPYAVVTGPDGAYELTDVPPGTYLLAAWHEKVADGRFQEGEHEVTLEANGTLTQDFQFERK